METLPLDVRRLAPREREVAAIVYSRAASTANEVQTLLSAGISNGAVRSMLNRLVCKGILARTCDNRPRGRGRCFIYLPAISSDDVKRKALRQLSERYFDGSLLSAGIAIFDLLEREAINAGSLDNVVASWRDRREGAQRNGVLQFDLLKDALTAFQRGDGGRPRLL